MKKFLAIALSVIMLVSMFSFSVNASNELTVTGAYKISDTQIKLTFSEAVWYYGNGEIYVYIMDDNGNVIPGGPGGYLQSYYGAPQDGTNLVYTDNNKSLIITMDSTKAAELDCASLNDVIAAVGTGGKYESYKLGVRIQEGNSGDSDSLISTYRTDANGTYLTSNQPDSTGADRSVVEVSAVNPEEPIMPTSYAQITEAYRIAENSIKVKFSEPVQFGEGYEVYLCYVDAEGNLQWDGSNPLQMYYGAPGTAGVKYADDNQSVVYTFKSENSLGVASLDEAIKATEEGGKYEGYKLVIRIEENKEDNDGVIGAVTAISNGAPLLATHASVSARDRAIVEVDAVSPEPPETPEKVDPNALTVVGAYKISDTSIKLIFSDRVNLDGKYEMYLCYVDGDNNLMFDGATPLQIYYGAPGTAGIYFSDYQYSLTFKIDGTRTDTLGFKSVTEALKAIEEGGKYEGYKLAVRIEETASDKDNTIAAVTRITDGTPLTANAPAESDRDRTYAVVSLEEPPAIPEYEWNKVTEGFRVISATAVSDKKLVVELSEKFNFNNGNGFMCVRYVDSANNLMWDGETPLQFTGKVEQSLDGSKIVWTLDGEENLFDIINFTGKYAKYEGMYAVFCIEEYFENGKDTEDGTVDNVVSLKGEKLVANKIGIGEAFDGSYTAITINKQLEIPETGDINIGIILALVACSSITLGFIISKKRNLIK